MSKKNILIVGGGGREHALAWKIGQSEQVGQIFVAPGNAGTAVSCTNVNIKDNDIDGLLAFAKEKSIDLTVVGPEIPLSLGVVDRFQAAGLAIFGPSQKAAELESSKAFAKAFMFQASIPTACSQTFTDFETAHSFLEENWRPDGRGVVVKASGLAAGKGVIVCDTKDEAQSALKEILVEQKFGESGNEVIIEERLFGPEVSVLAFSDGKTAVPMLPARDHKRVFDNDEGPNTGGMGVYAPPPDVSAALIADICKTVLEPTIQGMADNGTPYIGILYAGLMLTEDGPKVLEFNCRFGDPETQVLLPMLDGDLVEIMEACLNGRLSSDMIKNHEGGCAAVVMASPGYPASYPKGLPISGLDHIPAETLVFHAGTKMLGDLITTSGGRVLAVCARGNDLDTAVEKAYTGVKHIHFEGAHYRTDIGR
ncbi:MAG: phosphoribosylamine--glycine ligase [Chloroflexota bacterium]